MFFMSLLVSEAISILKKSRKPLILLGSQATLPPVNAEKLKESLEVGGIEISIEKFSKHTSRALFKDD